MVLFVEHLVLFKAKEGRIEARLEQEWLAKLNKLSSLEGVLYLKASKITSGAEDAKGFTHGLHARFSSKSALESYAVDPRHLEVVEIGKSLCSELIAVDWEAEAEDAVCGMNNSSNSFLLLKLKEGFHYVPAHVLSAGPNFSTRGQGFNFGCIIAGESDAEAYHDLCEDYISFAF